MDGELRRIVMVFSLVVGAVVAAAILSVFPGSPNPLVFGLLTIVATALVGGGLNYVVLPSVLSSESED